MMPSTLKEEETCQKKGWGWRLKITLKRCGRLMQNLLYNSFYNSKTKIRKMIISQFIPLAGRETNSETQKSQSLLPPSFLTNFCYSATVLDRQRHKQGERKRRVQPPEPHPRGSIFTFLCCPKTVGE